MQFSIKNLMVGSAAVALLMRPIYLLNNVLPYSQLGMGLKNGFLCLFKIFAWLFLWYDTDSFIDVANRNGVFSLGQAIGLIACLVVCVVIGCVAHTVRKEMNL